MPAYNFKDLTGQKFGRLTVIKRADNNKNGSTRWLCKCDCGNTIVISLERDVLNLERSCIKRNLCLTSDFNSEM